ncbi:MAG: sulfite reductase subunit alpha [Acidobacteriaceae bacterium]
MPESLVPYIPEDAPFTSAQRAWLNGFLAGLYSYAPAEKAEPIRVAVLYGSQTGTAEGLARKLAKELKAAGLEAVLTSLEGYIPATLATETYAVFIVSTYGEGEPPDVVQPFYQYLCLAHLPLLGNLYYAVCALGDKHYEHFCKFGRDLDAKLEALGGMRILDRVDCDVDLDAPFAAWKQRLAPRLREVAQQPVSDMPATAGEGEPPAATKAMGPVAVPELPHTKDNPYLSPLVEKRNLTHAASSKRTVHLEFDITDAPLRYEVGDACGIAPENCPALVDEALRLLQFTGEESVELGGASLTLGDALRHQLTITRVTRTMVSRCAELGDIAALRELLQTGNQTALDEFVHGRDLVDLVRHYPGAIQKPADLVKMLPRLAKRLYSISSSPAAHPGRVHTTISVVRYHAHERERGGVCSTHLSDRTEPGDRLPIYIQPNKKFRLPADPRAPVIMIGPGTGIAPFRAFLHERRAIGATGRNWLFFGDRNETTDFLYREELEAMHQDGHLARLDTAFSRDRQGKVYVQDRMLEQAPQLWAWLNDGAYFYVCGDATRMAKDVDRALRRIAQEQSGHSQDAADEYVENLKEQRRYQRDIY